MSSNNRGDRIQLLQKVLKKHYKPVSPVEGRTVLEQLVYASCLEDAPYDAADEAFQRVQEVYFDWNEIRVTTVHELADALRNLPDPNAAAARIKRGLQAIFETRYSFDLEDMHKMNQGKAIQEIEKFTGVSRFMLAYVIQHSFGGHNIPVSSSIMNILTMTGIVSPAEAEKHQTPGLERAITKTKGLEFASCLHQMAAEYRTQPTGKNIKAILKEAGGVEPIKPEPSKPAARVRRAETPNPEPTKAEPAKSDSAKSDSAKSDSAKSDRHKSDSSKPDTKQAKADAKDGKDNRDHKVAQGGSKLKKPQEDKDVKKPVIKKALPSKKPPEAKTPAAAPKKSDDKKAAHRKPK